MISRSASLLLVGFTSACASIHGPQTPALLAGDWQLVSFVSPGYSAEVPPTTTPPIVRIATTGSGAEGSISGNDGCNDWSGAFRVPEEGRLAIGPLAQTLRMCIRVFTLAEGGYAGTGVSDVTRYERSGATLVLSSEDDKTKITLHLP